MGVINYKADPLALTGSKVVEWDKPITDWLANEDLNPSHITIIVNGQVFSNIVEDPFSSMELFRPLTTFDNVSVINTPKGFDPITIAIVAVAAAASLATVLLMPAINPNNSGTLQESPNNTLQAQTNIARPYQAIPDVYGEPVCIPDLSGEATQEYVQQDKGPSQKIVTQLMPISLETYEVDEVFTSKTPLSGIGGSYTVFQPSNKNTVVPLVRETFSINEIDGQELYAPNQVESQFTKEVDNVSEDPVNRVENVQDDEFKLYTVIDLTGAESVTLPTSGILNLKYVPSAGVPPVDANSTILVSSIVKNGSVWEVSFTSDNQDVVSEFVYFSITLNDQTTIGPFDSEVDGDQLWIDFIFPRGLDGTAVVEVNYSVTGDGGTFSDTIDYTFKKKSLDQQFYTEKLTSPVGPGKWTISFIRTNNVGGSSNPSQVKLERVATIREYENKAYGNVTILEVVVPATLQATSLRENKINVNGGRMVIGYDRQNGAIDYTLRRSRLGADHILHEYVSVFGSNPDSLDLETLYEIYDNLPDPRLGYFDWTFDDLNVSLGQRINTIANAARIYVIPQGSVYTFRRDELQDFPSTILTRRDIAKNRQYKYSYKPQMNSDKDSVRVEYVDAEFNKKAFIELKYENGQFVDGVGVNPLKIELPCCKEKYNAMNRAQLEIRKLYYLRETISDTFLTGNANLIEQGELIRYEEVYNDSVIGGEVRSFNGLIVNLSEEVPDEDGLTFEWVMSNGRKSEQALFTKTGPKQIKLLSSPVGMFQPTVNNDKGSSYLISTVSTLSELEYIAGAPSYSNDGRTVQLTLSKHDARVYEYDEV